MIAEGFDIRKNIIPAATIQAHDARTQGMQNFVHFKSGRQGFNQHGDLHGAERQPKAHFDKAQDFFPQCRFFHALQFRNIKIRPIRFFKLRFGVMESKQS